MSIAENPTDPNAANVEQEKALRVVENAIVMIDEERRSLAKIYGACQSHSITEVEIGNCISLVRKALHQLRKSSVQLAQPPLIVSNN